jgi:PST family polysaccharide transporter
VPVIRILAFLPFITALSNILSVQVMVNFGLKRLLARILTVAGILNIVMALLLVVPLKHVGAALASLSAEIFVTLAVFIALRRNNLDVFSTRRWKQKA